MNKKREKNEKREDKSKTIGQLMLCLTCKALRTQEIGLAYFGCQSSGHISGCGRKPESPWWLPRSKLRRKNESGCEEADLLMGHLMTLKFY